MINNIVTADFSTRKPPMSKEEQSQISPFLSEQAFYILEGCLDMWTVYASLYD